MAAGADTKYLQETIGEALARGCAATITAQPSDPVEYLGTWLLRYVKNAEIEGSLIAQRQKELEDKKKSLTAATQAEENARDELNAKKTSVADLEKLDVKPRQLFISAVNLVTSRYPSLGGVYAAYVLDPEEPDWAPPEGEDDPPESEDEAVADSDPAAAAAEGEAAEEAAPGEGNADPAPPSIQKPVDYSKKYLSYVTASQGQEFIVEKDLFRPGPPPEDADPDAPQEPIPFSFRVLDERQPMFNVPNVAFEPRIRFFKNFPKIGGYQVCGVQSGGEYKGILAADSLFPESGGQPIPKETQDFIWEVSLAVSRALERIDKQCAEKLGESSPSTVMDCLKSEIRDIRAKPLPDLPEVDEAANPEAAEGEEAPPPEPEPESEPPAPAEGEGAEGGEEGAPPTEGGEAAPPPDPHAKARKEIAKLEKAREKLLKKKSVAEARDTKAKFVLDIEIEIKDAIIKNLWVVSEAALERLTTSVNVLQATYHIIKALLHLLGNDASTFSSWKRCYDFFSTDLLVSMQDYDAMQERDMSIWKRARRCYRTVTDPKRLELEMPESFFGVFVLQFIKQVRRVARRAVEWRATQAVLKKAMEELEANEKAANELIEAIEKAELEAQEQAEAEEAARAEKAAGEEEAALADGEGGEAAAFAEDTPADDGEEEPAGE